MSQIYVSSVRPRTHVVRALYHFRLRDQGSRAYAAITVLNSSKSQHKSLFDELFPEQGPDGLGSKVRSQNDAITPRLHLPEVGNIDEGVEVDPIEHDLLRVSTAASAYRLWDLAILVLSRASKSLLDGDFRRIAPNGRHIGDWKGPGDILKGICIPALQ